MRKGDATETPSVEGVREDFDGLAGLLAGPEEGGWDHNSHYHDFLLGRLPARLGEALDVGCGTGGFARRLSERSDRVVAIDLSPRTIEGAEARSAGHPNVGYAVANANSRSSPTERFDCVASLTKMHHLPLGPTLARMRDALRPGATLLFLGLYRARSIADHPVGAVALPTSMVLRLAKTGGLEDRRSPGLRRAWREHGETDTYPTPDGVRRACSDVLPGARVRRRLLWRYTLTWRKPVR